MREKKDADDARRGFDFLWTGAEWQAEAGSDYTRVYPLSAWASPPSAPFFPETVARFRVMSIQLRL